jgi:DNA-binding protein YbaB
MDIEAMRMRAADALARFELIRQNYGELQRQLSAVIATATSDDGLVTVTVGPNGRVVDVEIDPRIYRRPDSRRLGETITATIQVAAAAAADDVRELCRPYFLDEEVTAQLDFDIAKVVDRVGEELHGAGGAR